MTDLKVDNFVYLKVWGVKQYLIWVQFRETESVPRTLSLSCYTRFAFSVWPYSALLPVRFRQLASLVPPHSNPFLPPSYSRSRWTEISRQEKRVGVITSTPPWGPSAAWHRVCSLRIATPLARSSLMQQQFYRFQNYCCFPCSEGPHWWLTARPTVPLLNLCRSIPSELFVFVRSRTQLLKSY